MGRSPSCTILRFLVRHAPARQLKGDMRPTTPVDPSASASQVLPIDRRVSWLDLALSAAAIVGILMTVVSIVWVDLLNAVLGTEPSTFILRDTDKAWLLTLWLTTGVLALLALWIEPRLDLVVRRRWRIVVAAVATTSLVVVVVLATLVDEAIPGVPFPWRGFGVGFLAAGMLLAPLVFLLARWIARRNASRRAFVVSSLIAFALGIWQLFQTPNTFLVDYNNQYTIEELLAPAAGRMPGFDYVHQYESLLGYPLALLSVLIPGPFHAMPDTFAIAWMFLLQVTTLVLAVAAVALAAPKRLRWAIPLFVIPLAFLPGDYGLPYYAALPVRFFLPTVMVFLIVLLGRRAMRTGYRWWMAGLFGILAGAAAYNNLDYGVPALLAGGVTVIALALSWRRLLPSVGLYLLGVVLVPALVIVAGAATGRPFESRYALFFALRFGVDGFLNLDAAVLGLHTAFAALGVIGVVLGVLGVRRHRGRARVLHAAMLFESSWLLLSLVYFSGRSATATLVTGSAFIAAVLAAQLAVAGYPHVRILVRRGWRTWRRREITVVIVVALVTAMPLAALPFFPAPWLGAGRIIHGLMYNPGIPAFLKPDPTEALATLPADAEVVGLLAVSGSAWNLKLGVPNASLFLHPDYFIFPDAALLQCEYLRDLPGEIVVTTRTIATALAQYPACTDVLDLDGADSLLPIEGGVDGDEWLAVSKRG